MITKAYYNLIQKIERLSALPFLLIRLVLAYGFFGPAMMKLGNLESIADWFGQIGIPFPLMNAYLAAGTEITGVILLTLGLGTRLIAIPLMITMLVAIFAVHISNGFEAGNNGFEIPLYYLILLFTLFVYGAGKISLDYLIDKMQNNN